MQGGIIQAALELVKEKEKQGEKASERLHDGMKTQMELTASQGSWTGEQRPSQVVKEKETVVEKTKDDDEAKESSASETPSAPATPSSDDDDENKGSAASASIFDIAQGAK